MCPRLSRLVLNSLRWTSGQRDWRSGCFCWDWCWCVRQLVISKLALGNGLLFDFCWIDLQHAARVALGWLPRRSIGERDAFQRYPNRPPYAAGRCIVYRILRSRKEESVFLMAVDRLGFVGFSIDHLAVECHP